GPLAGPLSLADVPRRPELGFRGAGLHAAGRRHPALVAQEATGVVVAAEDAADVQDPAVLVGAVELELADALANERPAGGYDLPARPPEVAVRAPDPDLRELEPFDPAAVADLELHVPALEAGDSGAVDAGDLARVHAGKERPGRGGGDA